MEAGSLMSAPGHERRYALVVVGASWGGLEAVQRLLDDLPDAFVTPLVIAQHRTDDHGTSALCRLLQHHTKLRVVEADDKDAIEASHVYVAPAGFHLLVEPGGRLSVSTAGKVQFARPSIDLLFESAADAYGHRLIAVLLTGTGSDGANGALHVKRRGGITVAQDPASAERGEMPQSAIDAGAVDRVLGLDRIGGFLGAVCA
jgi:two-component system chemotaxis response regulator CheB